MGPCRSTTTPVCGKSRGALEILRERGVDARRHRVPEAPLDRATLERILRSSAGRPADLVRKDKRFAELGSGAADYTTREQVVDLLLRASRS